MATSTTDSTLRLAAIRLQADEPGQPSIDLRTLRELSDLERISRPGSGRARRREVIMNYLPALLDLVETAILASDPNGSGTSGVVRSNTVT